MKDKTYKADSSAVGTVVMLPKDRYLNIWTNTRRLENNELEFYEVNTATDNLPTAKQTFDLCVKEEVNPAWLIDLHTGEVLDQKGVA